MNFACVMDCSHCPLCGSRTQGNMVNVVSQEVVPDLVLPEAIEEPVSENLPVLSDIQYEILEENK